jgi:hypothetical protein
MSKLDQRLQEWTAAGLLQPEQAKRIRAHEAAKPEAAWILSGLLLLGAIVIGIGMVSLIAANWAQIPAAWKLGGDFVLLGGLAFGCLRAWDSGKAIAFEVWLLLFVLFCLASIGLISQVFHTGGELYQALLLWAFITAGAALLARRSLVPFLWGGGLLGGLEAATWESPGLQSVFQRNLFAISLFPSLLAFCLVGLARRLAGEGGLVRALRTLGLVSGLLALGVAESAWFGIAARNLQMGQSYLPSYLLALGLTWLVMSERGYRPIQRILLLTTLGAYLLALHLPFWAEPHRLTSAFATLLVLALVAIFLASLEARRGFQLFLLLLGLRVLVLYFQALGGLAMTGVGLIVSGGLVMGLAVLWNKYRNVFAAWAEKVTR